MLTVNSLDELKKIRDDIINIRKNKIQESRNIFPHLNEEKRSIAIEKELDAPTAKEVRVVLRNCSIIDPENIEDYISQDGYLALAKVLTCMTPQEVIQCVSDSGLRGRGGAGFPTGKKMVVHPDESG